MKLTAKQELFISEYCIDLNATKAYKRAGYSVKSDDVACVNAMRLLGNARIKEEIDKRLLKRANDNGVSADMVLRDLVELKDKCLGRKPITLTQYNDKGNLENIEKTIFDASGAKSSLELLGKYLKMWVDRTENTNNNNNRNKEISKMTDEEILQELEEMKDE